jgi:hypothetical protein
VEKLHPLQGGIFRLKYRRDRRPTFPMEPVWAFYPKYWWETASKHVRMAQRWFAIDFMRRRILRDPQHRAYMDQALTAVADDDAETLDLLTQNDAARREVDRAKRIGRPKVAVGV